MDEWRAFKRAVQTWKRFKAHFGEMDKRRAVLKLSGAQAAMRRKHSVNNTTDADATTRAMQEDMASMFVAGVNTFAEAADESINAAIEKKFSALGLPKNQSQGRGSKDGNKEADDLRKQVDMLQRRLAPPRRRAPPTRASVSIAGHPTCPSVGSRTLNSLPNGGAGGRIRGGRRTTNDGEGRKLRFGCMGW